MGIGECSECQQWNGRMHKGVDGWERCDSCHVAHLEKQVPIILNENADLKAENAGLRAMIGGKFSDWRGEIQEQNEKMAEFSRRVIENTIGMVACGEIDGGTIQEWGVELGLLEARIFTQEMKDADPESDYDVGDTIYVFIDWMKEAADGTKS